jgi:hypothetical protein
MRLANETMPAGAKLLRPHRLSALRQRGAAKYRPFAGVQ